MSLTMQIIFITHCFITGVGTKQISFFVDLSGGSSNFLMEDLNSVFATDCTPACR